MASQLFGGQRGKCDTVVIKIETILGLIDSNEHVASRKLRKGHLGLAKKKENEGLNRIKYIRILFLVFFFLTHYEKALFYIHKDSSLVLKKKLGKIITWYMHDSTNDYMIEKKRCLEFGDKAVYHYSNVNKFFYN